MQKQLQINKIWVLTKL